VVTGVAAGLPGDRPFHDSLSRLLAGESFIKPVDEDLQRAQLEKKVVRVVKKPSPDGGAPVATKVAADGPADAIKVAASLPRVDLTRYGVNAGMADTMDRAVAVAVAAGLEALRDAGLVTGGPAAEDWALPSELQDGTGVMYATSFPALDAAMGEVMRFLRSRSLTHAHVKEVVDALGARLEAAYGPAGEGVASALAQLRTLAASVRYADGSGGQEGGPIDPAATSKAYEFDRKFLFRVLVLGNAQLAQIARARGPNMQTNAACAGTTQAIAVASDMLRLGRADRMVVLAGDNASSDTLLPWLGNGFRALGAASLAPTAEEAAMPFDCRRSGMVLGSGGIGMVLETEASARARISPENAIPASPGFKCRLVEAQYTNSAYHGAALDRHHIATELERFLYTVEQRHGITRADIATWGVYLSHETGTFASETASCAYNEVHALRQCFGEDLLQHLLLVNTKGLTGHPMGVSFEDVAAVQVLHTGIVPPMPAYTQPDTRLNNGRPLKLSRGGSYDARYALRFAAGFGSQVAFALYAKP